MAAIGILERMHGRTAPGVPRWAVWTALAITVCVLPSSLWRIAAIFVDVPLVVNLDQSSGDGSTLLRDEWAYIIALSVISEALALLSFGLVSRWGEVMPRWVPGLGGRRIPPLAAVIPAGLGATALLIFPYTLVMLAFGLKITGAPTELITYGWQGVAFWTAYLPLAAWGPLLAVLTVHYWRRRTALHH